VSNAVHPIDEIFWQAAQLAPGDERESFLDRTCGEDRELRQRVARLLQVQPQVEGFLERPFAGPAPLAALPGACDGPGSVIGPYKLLEQIGEGGMGVVYMAEQERPVRRKVALKIIKPGMDSKQVVTRFEAERQALALMDHPNIAKIHDAGTTDAGRPYFVMELVRGVPITEFCDQRRLTPRQRLELFIAVCQAIQHAHQKGIIHRDLKPTNVLVTLHDTMAVPKVIDFGIAKATGQRLTERTLFTHFAQLVGTPLYMSPEQAEMNSLDVDTRSDVYALGVLLYELLTGTTPFESETLKKVGLDEMRRIIREEEPPTPSQRLSTLEAKACSTVSERRGVEDRRLRQLLQGELDWIVMKALEKDRNRRYESASAFATDVQRYLNDEPVEACPPSTGYRLRKYVRRNRRWLVTAGVVAGALMAATAVSLWQAARATEAQHQAETDRKQAETAERQAATDAAIAKAVADFLQHDLLRQVDMSAQRGEGFIPVRNLTVKDALDRAAGRIDQHFQDQPLVEATIRMTIAEAYSSLGQYQLSLPHVKRAVDLSMAHLGPDAPETIGGMAFLARMYREFGRYQDSITLSKQVLEKQKARFGTDHPETLASMDKLAGAYDWGGEWGTSEQLYKQVREKRQAILGPTHPDTLGTMQRLAQNYTHRGQFHESVALHEKILALRNSADDPEWWLLVTYAVACQGAGKLDQAEMLFHKALAQGKRDDSMGGSDPIVLRYLAQGGSEAFTLGYLARNLLLQERYAEAEKIARESIALYEKERPEQEALFYFVSILGAVLCGQKNYTEAEPLLLQGYEGMKHQEALLQAVWKRRMGEAGQRVVHFYEETNQPEKAREWREKLSSEKPPR
jgi:serine/threonine protein kinase/tetratricopeptide (TPR) repeat protein